MFASCSRFSLFRAEVLLNISDFSAYQNHVHKPLCNVCTYLLEYHDDNQIGSQLPEVTQLVSDYVVRDVRVDEAKHVHLVDQTVLVVCLITMILTIDQDVRNDLVSKTVNENQTHVYK